MPAKKSTNETNEATPGRGPQPPRLSLTLTPQLKQKLRLAAALADMEENDWARAVLATAARRTVEKRYPDKVS